ncbi:MAG: glycosyltransferase family 87 protein [Candidatus Limnocylindrales bacterium]
MATQLPADLIDRPTRRRAGVVRRALRREVSRLRDHRRQVAIVILALLGGLIGAGLIARGEAAGADARAYWAAVRIWLNGGDPYHPTGPFMPYVYPPWMLPFFAPWALLPWDVAWFVWRGGTILLLAWTTHWAYRQRPFATAIVLLLLWFPFAANLDTGNITLLLTFLLWGAQSAGPRLSGLLWAAATWTKWIPAPIWLILEPRARAWGLAWVALALVLTLATLPATLVQVQTVLAFPRPIRVDYLVLLWAAVPWLWRHPHPLWWLWPTSWPGIASDARAAARGWSGRWRRSPEQAAAEARHEVAERVRTFLGLNA